MKKEPPDSAGAAESFHKEGPWIISSRGFLVRALGRAGMEYVESDTPLHIDSEAMATRDFEVYEDSLPHSRSTEDHCQHPSRVALGRASASTCSRAFSLQKIARLAIIGYQALLDLGDEDAAAELAADVLTRRTTDLGYTDLSVLVEWHQHGLAAASRAKGRSITHKRAARPMGRENPKPYQVG